MCRIFKLLKILRCNHDYYEVSRTKKTTIFGEDYLSFLVHCPKCGLTVEKNDDEWIEYLKIKEINENYFK